MLPEDRFTLSRSRATSEGAEDHYLLWDSERQRNVAVAHAASGAMTVLALRALTRFLNRYCPREERAADFLRRLLNNEEWSAHA